MLWLSDCLLHENERTAMFWSTDSELALQMCCIGGGAARCRFTNENGGEEQLCAIMTMLVTTLCLPPFSLWIGNLFRRSVV